MSNRLKLGLFVFCLIVPILVSAGIYAAETVTLDSQIQAITGYKFGDSREPLTKVEDMVTGSLTKPSEMLRLESQFASVLLSQNATYACKDFVCRQLNKIGTKASVPALSVLLVDEKTSDIARYALQQNPCPEAEKALLSAVGKTKGKTLIGIVNSLGERGDEKAIGALGKVLFGSDEESSVAAATALGKIGTTGSVKALEKARTLKSEKVHNYASRALLVCADNMMKKGENESAAEIFKSLCSVNESKQVRNGALIGLEKYLGE